VPRRNLMF